MSAVDVVVVDPNVVFLAGVFAGLTLAYALAPLGRRLVQRYDSWRLGRIALERLREFDRPEV